LIYFIRDEATNRIKIGTTIRLSQRLYQLGLMTKGPLHVLAVLPGSFADESALHERFKSLRVVGEWFKPEPELIDFITTKGQAWDGSDEGPRLVSIRLDSDIVDLVRIAAAMKRVSVSDYINQVLSPLIEEDIQKGFKEFKSRNS
jgi:hypothetical protein